jgi:hypothetical protein
MFTLSYIESINMALRGYYNEYGTYPNVNGEIPNNELTAAQLGSLYLILTGEDVDLAGKTGAAEGGNPRRINFLSTRKRYTKPVDANYRAIATGTCVNFVDSWGSSLRIKFDGDGDGKVDLFGGQVKADVAIWSVGPDGVQNPDESNLGVPTKKENQDNLGSWK